jgi:adenine-specific DNA-methyltransferase
MANLLQANRLESTGNRIGYVRYFDDFPVFPLHNNWSDVGASFMADKLYVVQTTPKVIERCILMTTDPGDLVLDPTKGSGTTAYAAEKWGRRWISIDISRIPLALARQRLLTATYPWYDLKDESRGPAGGFVYKRKQNRRGEEVGGIVPHITLKSIASNEPPEEEVLVDRPEVAKDIVRVTGPFTVEAMIAPPAEMQNGAGAAPALNGESNYQERMLEVLRHSPRLHLPGNRTVEFSGARVPARTQWLSAEAALINGKNEPVAVVFGPEHGAISDRLVYNAAIEANAKQYVLLVVVGFAIEANARRLIDACAEVCGIPAVYVSATMDLTMGDLLKNMRSSQILSVCGSPEIEVRRLPAVKGEVTKYQVSLLGLDVFNPVTMEVYHRDGADVPAWFLCTDYNDRVFHISQAFFPRTGAWDNLKRSLKGVYDDSLWQHLAGATSAPFEAGEHNQIAVKVIDDRGNELMIVRKLDEAKDVEPPPRKDKKGAPVQPAVARVTKGRGRKP